MTRRFGLTRSLEALQNALLRCLPFSGRLQKIGTTGIFVDWFCVLCIKDIFSFCRIWFFDCWSAVLVRTQPFFCDYLSVGLREGCANWHILLYICAVITYFITIVRINSLIMNALYTILLLVISNVFMTFAWYGHLKLQQMKLITSWPLWLVILFSWGIALAEYSCQIPANRIGFTGNGGPFTLMQLKVMQEVITLIIFTVFTTIFFKGETLQWNHFAAFVCLIAAVYFVFMK